LDKEIFDPIAFAQANNDVQDEIDALQQALLDGTDPTPVADATAAGPESQQGGNEGTTSVSVDFIAPEVSVTSGFETSGPSGLNVQREFFDGSNSLGQVLSGDLPVAVDDTGLETVEDTSITIDVLANDTISAGRVIITSSTEPSNGTVVLNSNGTFTYTPSANYSGNDSFSYTLKDSNGATSTATANIQVNAVADEPFALMLVSGQALPMSTSNLIVNGSFEDINGVTKTGYVNTTLPEGFLSGTKLAQMKSITGWDLTDPSMPAMEPHAKGHGGVGATDGQHFMDLGATPGNSSIVQQVAGIIDGAEYKISFDYLDKAAKMRSGQLGEDSGVLQVIWNGEVIAEVQGNNRTSWETINNLTVIGGSGDGTNKLIFSEIGLADDNHGMAIDNVEMFHIPYHYDLSVQVQLSDVDGSEVLSPVSIDPSVFPDGVYLNGVAINSLTTLSTGNGNSINNTLSITSDKPLTGEQINALTASVTSTETSNSDAATVTVNAKVLFPGFDASGQTDDLAILGDANNNTIIGGSGDDVIFGGAGADIITGGSGVDNFVWTKNDIGVGTPENDTVLDFNPTTDADVLTLSDLLSDGSHSIEGLAADDAVGSGKHLQLSIKNSAGDQVQTIDLNNISVGNGDDPTSMLNSLLSTGAINDGI
jgi:Ca2+-binding RTX toxin-like protein